MKCPVCGYMAETGYRFCQKCGHSFSTVVQTTSKANDGPVVTGTDNRRFWQRITFGMDKSVGGCIAMIVVGVIICSIGYAMLSGSTFLQWSGMRESQYIEIYGHAGLTSGQWCLAVVGVAVDLMGIVMAYVAIKSCLEKIKPANRQDSSIAKVVAIVLCIVAFMIAASWRSFVGDGKSHMSIWDYLILCAVWRGIWRGVVGDKKSK